ncbi:MAG: hypothetical protein ACYDBH_01055 [Acidobacteriaceae bacterium]
MPIIALTGQLAGFVQGALSSGRLSANDFFARFVPMAGGTTVAQAVGMYPFANQQVAANATIQEPVNISLRMIAPVKDTGGYLTKLAILSALSTSLSQHNNAGGTYIVATPANIYNPCLLLNVIDITGDQKQQQIEWQFNFIQPLISQQSATQAYNGLMSKFASGQQISASPAWSGPDAASGGPVQGAITQFPNITNMAGALNNFLSSPAF